MSKFFAFALLIFIANSSGFTVDGFSSRPEDLSFSFRPEDLRDSKHLWDLYGRWVLYYNVSRSRREMESRFGAFVENARFVESFTRNGSSSFTVKLNSFGDMTTEEFFASHATAASFFKNHPARNGPTAFNPRTRGDVPRNRNWTASGAVTEVKDELSCGSAWAFSALSAIEGWHQIQTGSLVALPVQELLECDTARSDGCGGGYTELAFDFVVKNVNGGITAEDCYPYSFCTAHRKFLTVCRTDFRQQYTDSSSVLGSDLISPLADVYIQRCDHHWVW